MRRISLSRRWGILLLLLLAYLKLDFQPDVQTPKATKYDITSLEAKKESLLLPHTVRRHSSRPRILDDPDTVFPLIESLSGGNGSSPHFLTTLSGCRMARWILPILGERPFRRDCYKEQELALLPERAAVLRVLTNQTIIGLIQTNDTIYMTYDQVDDFVKDTLPLLQVDVVLISGQREYVRAPPQSAIDQIVSNPHIIQWFCQNLPKYGGNNPRRHSKLTSFPFGIKQTVKNDPLQPTNGKDYEKVFRESLHQAAAAHLKGNNSKSESVKTNLVFSGYLTVASNANDRSQIAASTPFLPPLEFYRSIAASQYILSPNGDRPECYRHYEALGLGTAPITQLTRASGLFTHFEQQGSGLLFQEDVNDNDSTWDVKRLEKHLDPKPIVNRNLVLEEYWMEYVDWFVDRELTWWDRYSHPHGGPVTVPKLLEALHLME
jgi:hypothetical protein